MSELSFKKILDNPTSADLKKMGLSKEEFENMTSSLLDFKPESYKRVMNTQEKKIILPETFGYLVKLVHTQTISKEQFEKIINISLQLYEFIRKEITIEMLDVVLNFVVFTDLETISINELVDMLYLKENKNNNRIN